ncbi:MAG: hypothetical protein IJA55_00850 [Clostridia bacterium]|nr:hypothetical protein [Clostridia bacterium]
MKRLLILLLISVLLLPLCITVDAKTYVPSRTINLVYDDSGSMIRVESDYVDTWCQAKYAMEVFAGMLGENETLNIYYMSDFAEGDTGAPPKLSLKGSNDAKVTEANVKNIHDLITNASNTPFSSVKQAYEDLKNVTTDERWLVVLTDGEFNDASNDRVQNYFYECVADNKTRVMMLSMGPNAAVITPDNSKHIYFEKADTTKDIPAKLTEICNRIFQSNALEIDSDNTINFNVPMSQLVVFAQGKSVKIEGITASDGTAIKPSSNVHVRYSETATNDTYYPADKVKIADNLSGYVATFNTDFACGEYTVNVSGVEDIQVYYKPNVSIAAYLFDADNEEVTGKDNIPSGTYRIEFGFVNGTNGEKVTDTSLLGDIEYSSSIVNTVKSGKKEEYSANSGDTVTIKEGKLDIAVTAKFLEYNTVDATLSFDVFKSKDLLFTIDRTPVYTVSTQGLENHNDAIQVSVKIDSDEGVVDLSKTQLELLGMPEVSTDAEEIEKFKVEKGDKPGTFLLYPVLKDTNEYHTINGEISIKIKGEFTEGLSSAQGSKEGSFEVNNTVTAKDRITKWLEENWLKLTICLLLLFLILGYIPPFKKYLPRRLKKRPVIECSAETFAVKDKEVHGKYQRKFVTTLIPYKAETGYVVFSPSPYKKTAQIKAAGGNGMYVTNMKMFAGREEISFNGMTIEEGRTKPYRIGSNSTISLRSPEYTYTCYLNR